MSSIVYTPSSTPTSPSEGEVYYDSTSKELKVYGTNSSFEELGGAGTTVEPHIVTNKLHPAYLGKLLDATTSHSGAYGTAQADGRMYYYTDIAGSKPIHDPRIGAHFGSQRHKLKSLQLLEQETATHGQKVYSVDGREWIRATGTDLRAYNDANGIFLGQGSGTSFFEFVGYFSDANYANFATTTERDIQISVDGGSATTNTVFNVINATPLSSRCVDACSFANLGLGLSLGIHTLKLTVPSAEYSKFYAIELIAQDTTSATTRSQVQIPAQTVVSFGKKRSISAETKHYNPFAFKTDGSTAWTAGNHNGTSLPIGTGSSHNIDVATSLGLEKWKHSSNYYYPYNGMRVVRWVDENGAIKTSVTCMPPNAKSIGDSSILTNANAKANASVANDTFYPTFEAHTTSVNEDNLHEVAKAFHWREFGNGAANGGTGATWADASMLNGDDTIAYVMDDGLTSLSAYDVAKSSSSECMKFSNANRYSYHTFIGTGVSFRSIESTDAKVHVAQNLPYGSHVLKIVRGGTHTLTIDGVDVQTGTLYSFAEIDIYQPKKPPIPDSACVIADYMLLADFVPQSSAGVGSVSKGSRIVDCSRDLFYNATSGSNALSHGQISSSGFKINSNTTGSAGVYFGKVPAFGTNFLWKGYNVGDRGQLKVNGSNATQTTTTGTAFGHVGYIASGSEPNLGVNTFEATNKASKELMIEHFEIATPIHTSSHYQTFETPFLHDLVGGDRNMEQNNLICTSYGKSWDEITRDLSYIGSDMLKPAGTNGNSSSSGIVVFTKFRTQNEGSDLTQKNFALGYNRFICLRDGMYEIMGSTMKNINTTYHVNIIINGTRRKAGHSTNINHDTITNILTTHLKVGDYVELEGGWYGAAAYSHFHIIRLDKR
tara:strand:+ start:2262 stop:4919 length:2658 start_codon:yes stop_codon:yes gene_type:complete